MNTPIITIFIGRVVERSGLWFEGPRSISLPDHGVISLGKTFTLGSVVHSSELWVPDIRQIKKVCVLQVAYTVYFPGSWDYFELFWSEKDLKLNCINAI